MKYGWCEATGGECGPTYRVDELTDDGVRSAVEWACDTEDPRRVAFDVAGRIELEEQLTIEGRNVTFDGTGVTLSHQRLFVDNSENVIVKNVRHRLGSETAKTDCLEVWRSSNVLVDHCSFAWSRDEIASAARCHKVTIQNCILGYPLHYEGHGLGPILGGDRLAFINNIVAHCVFRPSVHGSILLANNIFYNYSASDPILVQPPVQGDPPTTVDIVRNQFFIGPNTQRRTCDTFRSIQVRHQDASVYLDLNMCRLEESMCLPVVRSRDGYHERETRQEGYTLPEHWTDPRYHAGAPVRDILDQVIVSDCYEGRGEHIQRETDQGGFPWLDG